MYFMSYREATKPPDLIKKTDQQKKRTLPPRQATHQKGELICSNPSLNWNLEGPWSLLLTLTTGWSLPKILNLLKSPEKNLSPVVIDFL